MNLHAAPCFVGKQSSFETRTAKRGSSEPRRENCDPASFLISGAWLTKGKLRSDRYLEKWVLLLVGGVLFQTLPSARLCCFLVSLNHWQDKASALPSVLASCHNQEFPLQLSCQWIFSSFLVFPSLACFNLAYCFKFLYRNLSISHICLPSLFIASINVSVAHCSLTDEGIRYWQKLKVVINVG